MATAVYQAAFFAAVARTGVALGTLVALGSTPVFRGLLARRLSAERLPPAWAASTACAIVGCGLLLLPEGGASVSVPGVALSLVAGACYGIYTVCAKHLLDSDVDPLVMLTGTLGLGAIVLCPVLATGIGQLATTPGAILVAWVASAATAGAYVLFVAGLARVPAARPRARSASPSHWSRRCWASSCSPKDSRWRRRQGPGC